MTETQARARTKEPSHLDLLRQINGRFDTVEARLERGETRFDRLEAKIDAADAIRAEMASDVKVLQATADANKTPPWWLGPKPVAIIVALAALAGAGLGVLSLAQMDIVPKLTAIKEAVQ